MLLWKSWWNATWWFRLQTLWEIPNTCWMQFHIRKWLRFNFLEISELFGGVQVAECWIIFPFWKKLRCCVCKLNLLLLFHSGSAGAEVPAGRFKPGCFPPLASDGSLHVLLNGPRISDGFMENFFQRCLLDVRNESWIQWNSSSSSLWWWSHYSNYPDVSQRHDADTEIPSEPEPSLSLQRLTGIKPFLLESKVLLQTSDFLRHFLKSLGRVTFTQGMEKMTRSASLGIY